MSDFVIFAVRPVLMAPTSALGPTSSPETQRGKGGDILEPKDLEKMKKTPAFAISLLGVDASITELRTSGWTDQLETIVGYIELPKADEDKIKKLSGKGGVFVSSLRKHVVAWPAVSWRHPEQNESMKHYFERSHKAATELDLPLAYRRGGGAAIGIVVDQEEEGQEHAWVASGVPHIWGPVSFRQWLETQGWTILDCRAPASKSQQWSFRGLLKGQKDRSYSYQLEGEDDAYIMIKRWEKRRKIEGDVVPLGGSSWWHKDATFDDPIEVDDEVEPTVKWEAEIAETVPDTEMEASAENGKGEKSKMEESTGSSPPKKKVKGGGKKKAEDIDKIVGGMPGPGKKSTIIDTGGCGDCGWRALSFSVGAHNATGGTTDEDLVDRLDIISKTMQAKVATYVINHKKEWADSWCVDPNTTEQMEDWPIAQNIEEFCNAIRRRKHWVCGLVMAGAAMAQRVNIVIWTKKEGEWVRIAILRCGSDWQSRPVIPLILSRGGKVQHDFEASTEWHVAQGNADEATLDHMLFRGGAKKASCKKKRQQTDSTLCWSLNCGGLAGTWRMMHLLEGLDSQSRPKIVFLQEVSCSDSQWINIQAFAKKIHYKGFFVGGKETGGKAGDWHRGVITLIHEDCHARWDFDLTWEHGQVLAVVIDHILVINSYIIPNEEAIQGHTAKLEEYLVKADWQGKWLWIGDWNEEYYGSWTATLASLHGGSQANVDLVTSSRWKGDRVIDYPITNFEVGICITRFEAISDHCIIEFSLPGKLKTSGDHCRFIPGQSFVKPGWITPNRWQELFDSAFRYEEGLLWREACYLTENFQKWDEEQDQEQLMVDYCWTFVMAQVSCTFRMAFWLALHEIPEDFDKLDKVRTVTNIINRHVIVGAEVKRQTRSLPQKGAKTSMRMAKMSKRLGRLHELARRLRRQQWDGETISLAKKLYDSTDINLDVVMRDLHELSKKFNNDQEDEKNQKLSLWKQRIRENASVKADWLNKKGSTMTPTVVDSHGISTTKQQAVEALKEYWNNLWKEQDKWTENELQQRTAEIVGLLRSSFEQNDAETTAQRPSLALFQERMKHINGCAGADAWSKHEMKTVAANDQVAALIWKAMQLWEDTGKIPTAIHCCKLVCIAKKQKRRLTPGQRTLRLMKRVEQRLAFPRDQYFHVLYMDDRTFIGSNMEMITEAQREWKETAERFKLRENMDKAQIVNTKEKNGSFEVLGTVIGLPTNEDLKQSRMKARQEKAKLLYRKIGLLPITMMDKIRDVGTFIKGVLSYGWVSKTLTVKMNKSYETIFWRSLGKTMYSSPYLRRTLVGAHTSLCMIAGLKQMRVLSKRNRILRQLGISKEQCLLDVHVARFLEELHWKNIDEDTFQNEFTEEKFKLEDLLQEKLKGKIEHYVRESYRLKAYMKFCSEDRHEIRGEELPVYSEFRRKTVVKWIDKNPTAMLAAIGGIQSPLLKFQLRGVPSTGEFANTALPKPHLFVGKSLKSMPLRWSERRPWVLRVALVCFCLISSFQGDTNRTFGGPSIRDPSGSKISILLTRQVGENGKLLKALEEAFTDQDLSADLVEVPCIEHAKGPDFKALEEYLATKMEDLEVVLLTSPEAARVFADAARRRESSSPIRVASVLRLKWWKDSSFVPSNLTQLVPTFDPSADDVETWAKKVELLAKVWPKEKIAELVTRLILNTKGSAFQKLQIKQDELLKNDVKCVQRLVELVGGQFGQIPLERRYEFAERALFRCTQKNDESHDSYLARADVAWSEVISRGVKLEELQAYVVLRGSLLSAEDKKRVLVEAGAEAGSELTMARVSAAVRMLGAGFFQEYTGGKRTKLKTYDQEAFITEEAESTSQDIFATQEDDHEEEYLEALLQEGDDDAVLITEYETAINDTIQDDPELATALNAYADARRRLSERFRNRGFWPVKNYGKSGGKGKGYGKGKGKGGRRTLQDRILSSRCRICNKMGHWKAACPERKSQSSSSAGPTASIAVSESVHSQVTDRSGQHTEDALMLEFLKLPESITESPIDESKLHFEQVFLIFSNQARQLPVCSTRLTNQIMSDLALRLQKIQRREAAVLADISHHTLQELSEMKIKFGSTHVGRSFQHMWDVEQEYITWFLQRYSRSTKLDHRLFVRFVELQIQRYEDWGGTVPVTSERAQTQTKQISMTATPKMTPKAKSKSRAAGSQHIEAVPAFLDMSQEEEFEFLQDEWQATEILNRVNAPPDPEVQTLQNRMLNLENALQQVINHLQSQSKAPVENPEQP
eukprot:symbB.v1.2.004926.t1/scaffold281.1/size241006/7